MTTKVSQHYFKDFIPLNHFNSIICEAVYSFPAKTHFNSYLVNQFPSLYHPEATIIWAHKDIALITLVAAEICRNLFQWRLKVVDCFRPVDAQIKMADYGFHPSLVSPPGAGAHPRAMAIDIVAEYCVDNEWHSVAMGTEFDFFSETPDHFNPAARHFVDFQGNTSENWQLCLNRYQLEFAMRRAAALLHLPLYPICQEWWDFRLPESFFSNYKALHEADVPGYMRMINPNLDLLQQIKQGIYPENIHSRLESITKTVKSIII